MRVVAGSAGGVPLTAPDSVARPTMDKVRNAIFSSLGDAVPGSRVLDLFAGTGALGIEALSRGAASAVFVDSHRAAIQCIQKNLTKTRLDGRVQAMDFIRFIGSAPTGAFDLIFADPPYTKRANDTDWVSVILQSERLPSLLAAGGTLILEAFAPRPLSELTAWHLLRTRIYGESAVHFLTHAASATAL